MDRLYIAGGPSTRGPSTYKDALRCLRFYAFRRSGKGRSPSEAQATGSVIHAGVAHFRARQGAAQSGGFNHAGVHYTHPDQILTPDEAVERSIEEERARGGEPSADKARGAVNHYVAKCSRERLRILAVEEEYKVEIALPGDTRPALFTTRVDLVAQSPQSGIVTLWDTKTTAVIKGNSHARYYSVDLQFLGLRFVGQQLYGERFGGAVLDMVQREPPHRIFRPRLNPAPYLQSQFVQVIQDVETRIRAMERAGRPPSEWPAHPSELTCFHRYGPCACLEFCRWGPDALGVGGS